MTCESATEIAKSFTVLNAVLMISKAMSDIKEATVINCFDKAGFSEFQEIIETDIIESKKLKELLDEFDEGVPRIYIRLLRIVFQLLQLLNKINHWRNYARSTRS